MTSPTIRECLEAAAIARGVCGTAHDSERLWPDIGHAPLAVLTDSARALLVLDEEAIQEEARKRLALVDAIRKSYPAP